jgi:hypothetical protein
LDGIYKTKGGLFVFVAGVYCLQGDEGSLPSNQQGISCEEQTEREITEMQHDEKQRLELHQSGDSLTLLSITTRRIQSSVPPSSEPRQPRRQTEAAGCTNPNSQVRCTFKYNSVYVSIVG